MSSFYPLYLQYLADQQRVITLITALALALLAGWYAIPYIIQPKWRAGFRILYLVSIAIVCLVMGLSLGGAA